MNGQVPKLPFNQGDAGRFEEYITLREEMLQLHSYCRQILYWSSVFAAVGLTWYLDRKIPSGAKTAALQIPSCIFAYAFLLALSLPFAVYFFYMDQIYRIGSYISVFWESNDQRLMLMWHRFNRSGKVTVLMPHTAVLVFMAIIALSALILHLSSVYQDMTDPFSLPNVSIDFLAIAEIIIALLFVSYLTKRRNRYEEQWRKIKGSINRQQEIHDQYVPIPPQESYPSFPLCTMDKLKNALITVALVGMFIFFIFIEEILKSISKLLGFIERKHLASRR